MSVYIHICLHKYIHLDMFMFSLLIWPVWSSSYRTSWSSRLEILSRPVHVTHPLVCRDSFMSVTWLILVGNSIAPCVTWLIHECAVTHSWVWHDIFSSEILMHLVSQSCVTWLIHECGMTHSRRKLNKSSQTHKRLIAHSMHFICVHLGVYAQCQCISCVFMLVFIPNAFHVCACLCVCMCVCVYVCMCMCACACHNESSHTHKWVIPPSLPHEWVTAYSMAFCVMQPCDIISWHQVHPAKCSRHWDL